MGELMFALRCRAMTWATFPRHPPFPRETPHLSPAPLIPDLALDHEEVKGGGVWRGSWGMRLRLLPNRGLTMHRSTEVGTQRGAGHAGNTREG